MVWHWVVIGIDALLSDLTMFYNYQTTSTSQQGGKKYGADTVSSETLAHHSTLRRTTSSVDSSNLAQLDIQF